MDGVAPRPEVRTPASRHRACRKTGSAAVFAFTLLGFAGLVLAGPSTVTRRIVERIPLAGYGEAVVLHRYGNVVVVGTADAGASVDALVRVAARHRTLAQEFADRVKIITFGQGDSFVIATAYPSDVRSDPELGYDVQLSIRLPAGTVVSVSNSFGDVKIAGLNGNCSIVNRFGDVELDRCDRCEVENSYGRVRLSETRGLAVVRNSYGDVDLRLAGGPVQVRNRYGTVHTEQSADDVTIDNQFGNVYAHPDRGALSITNRYGDINAWVDDADLAALNIMSRLGRVDLSLDEQVPFHIDATARGGRIVSGLPFAVRGVAAGQQVSAQQGIGGPQIDIRGVWSDFAIHGARTVSDTQPGEKKVQR